MYYKQHDRYSDYHYHHDAAMTTAAASALLLLPCCTCERQTASKAQALEGDTDVVSLPLADAQKRSWIYYEQVVLLTIGVIMRIDEQQTQKQSALSVAATACCCYFCYDYSHNYAYYYDCYSDYYDDCCDDDYYYDD